PRWARSSAFVGHDWVVKFAWSDVASVQLEQEGRVTQALGAALHNPPVRRITHLSADPVLIVSPFVPGSPVTGEAIARYSPSEVQRLGAELAGALVAFHSSSSAASVDLAGMRLPPPVPQAGTFELRQSFVPMLDGRRARLVNTWCDFADEVLSTGAEAVVVHGDFHGHNIILGDEQRVRVVLDLELAAFGDYHYDFRYLPAQAATLDLFRATVAEYETRTARVVDNARVMAWHVRTVLGDALWRTAAGIPLFGGGTKEAWIDELADRFDALGFGRLDEPRAARPRIDRVRTTARLRLEPIGPQHADDLWLLHQDPGVAEWQDRTWTRETVDRYAADSADSWAVDGVHRWMAYDSTTGALVGRGGLSKTVVDGARRLEVGWTVRSELWGRGYASEIGRAALAVAFDESGAGEVVAFTEPHNVRSRAVMERIGMTDPRAIDHNGVPFVLYTMRPRPAPPLLPPDVVALICDLRTGLEHVLGDDCAGLFLYGALLFEHPPHWRVDIDFHVLVRARISPAQREALHGLHRWLAAHHRLGCELDGYYVTLDDASQTEPPVSQYDPAHRDGAWALHRAHVHAGRYTVVAGIDPRRVVPQPTWDELRGALQSEMAFIEAHPEEHAFAVLNACRILYSVRTYDVVVSKHQAGQWGREHLGPDDALLIEAALRHYSGDAAEEDYDMLRRRSLAFAAFVSQSIAQ
ncbi:MAG: [ribosomal protein S5]-alanine N-acetyltransferase, partial [Actinomycetota bacterium]|nr:[ribosomal protein S5]-alanine N-acetyltransferase [Actinomycetota bacterium]